MKINQIIESKDTCAVCGQTPCNCTHVTESQVQEFAPAGGGGSGDYLKALASAWYNGVFDTGSLPRGIKTQEDVERLLNRGIVCPDGRTRKLHIDYNSDFDGVVIYSDDYYEHGDESGELDSRTGQPFGPYDHVEYTDDELDESMTEGQLNEGEQLFYARNPDGTRTYARIKDSAQLAQLQQRYAGSEVKLMSFDRPDVAQWLTSRGVNLRGFLPGMVITKGLSEDQDVAEGSLNELSSDLLQRAAQGAKVKRDQALDPEVHNALGGGYMNPLAKHYDTVAKKFSDKAVKVGQKDAVKKIASPAVMRKIGIEGVAEGKMAELEMDLEDSEISDSQFEKMYGMTRKEAREQFSQTDMWAFPEIRDPNRPLHEKGVAEGALNEFAPDSNDGSEDDVLHRYARMWWAGNEATQQQIERALAKMGWEIGEDEGSYDNGGVFVVRAGDVNGRSYQSWPAEELDEARKKPEPPEADYGQDFQDMVDRVKKLAGLGPLKTVYDPKKRVYRNVPQAEQPKK